MPTQLSDLDSLAEQVKNPHSRALIDEAIAAYRAGAMRSAVVMCWSAVFGDLISKIRELSEQGNNVAEQYVGEIERNAQNPGKMLRVEREIIDRATNEFLMFNHRDQTQFNRLREDRNSCAHPTLAGDEGHFVPIPEAVRAHIAHALDRLLIRPPSQGKEALVRLWHDLDETRLPKWQPAATQLVTQRYVESGTKTLRSAIAHGARRGLLLTEDPFQISDHQNYEAGSPFDRRRGFLACLSAVLKVDSPLFDEVVATYFDHLDKTTDDSQKLMTLLLLSWEPALWSRLKEPMRAQIAQITEQTILGKLSNLMIEQRGTNLHKFVLPALGCIDIPDLAPIFNKLKYIAFDDFNEGCPLILRPVSFPMIDKMISLFAASGSYRNAEANLHRCVWPIRSDLRPNDVSRIFNAVLNNNQITHASGIPHRLAELVSHLKQRWETQPNLWKDKFDLDIQAFWTAIANIYGPEAIPHNFGPLYEELFGKPDS
ncbi:hypothetical protein AB3X55_07395 [Alphaproteobacteria bacterium LSUCC0719]